MHNVSVVMQTFLGILLELFSKNAKKASNASGSNFIFNFCCVQVENVSDSL